MAVKIRLQRTGRIDKPFYRIVAVEKSAKRDGKTLEIIGTVDATVKPPFVKADKILMDKWVKNGAILSDAVRKLTIK